MYPRESREVPSLSSFITATAGGNASFSDQRQSHSKPKPAASPLASYSVNAVPTTSDVPIGMA